jgi:hypothetical protein
MLQFSFTIIIKQLLCLIFLFIVTSSIQFEFSGRYQINRSSVSEQIMSFESDCYHVGLDNPTWQTNPVEQHEPHYSFSRIPTKIYYTYNSFCLKYFFPLQAFHFRI